MGSDPKKTPLLQLASQSPERLQISQAPGSRKHAVHQPAYDPVPRVASRGQVSKVTSSIRSSKCTLPATRSSFVFTMLGIFFGAASCQDCVSVTQLVIGNWLLVLSCWLLARIRATWNQPPGTEHQQPPMRFTIVSCLLLMVAATQAQDDEFRVYTEHPRLILTPQRLRLLKRERERESRRWRQFDLLVKGSASQPEPGFALALYYAVSGEAAAGKKAIEWALGPGQDLRQLALVYDWCQPVLSAKEAAGLEAKIRGFIQTHPGKEPAAQRDRILALIATADDSQHSEEAPLEQAVRQWWRSEYAPLLGDGRATPQLPDVYPLLETLHAIRDNLKIDLRDAAPGYFAHLPKILVIGNYPAPYRAPENEFRIPMNPDSGRMDSNQAPPDLNRAALARAAGLSMVAYDTNGLENQFLQGWLIQDRFSLMTPFGAPYEFLWANPYQPGLSYFQLPLVFHDENSGTLFVRSAWDEDADWFGLYGGEAELFREGRITVVSQGSTAPKPVEIGDTSVIFGKAPVQFSTEGGMALVIGLKPQHPYLVETDDEEMREMTTDRAGTLVLDYPSSRTAGVRIHAPESEGNLGKGGA